MKYMMRRAVITASFAALCGVATFAHSHALWDPQGLVKPRSNRDDIKVGPCGEPRGSNPLTLSAGATVNLSIERTIYHRGYFRIAFSPANDLGFDDHVLADHIPETSGQRFYNVSVKLPDVACDACTLQLIQVMLDRSPPTNYYSCADIRLVKAAPQDTQPPAAVSQVLATPGDRTVQLNWHNPDDSDLAGILILEASQAFTNAPASGQTYSLGQSIGNSTVVFGGVGDNVVLPDRRAGQSYHYRLFAYDQSLNYSAPVSAQVALSQSIPNLAPTVTLLAEQNGNITDRIKPDGGTVRVQATINDANNRDSHTLMWSVSDDRIIDEDSIAEQFSFDPRNLPVGEYDITVAVTDNGEPPMTGHFVWNFSLQTANQPAKGGTSGILPLLLLSLGLFRRFHLRSARD